MSVDPSPALATVAADAQAQIVRLERQLAQLRAELEHSHRLSTVGTLTAGLAHEINNILTPALGYSQLIQTRPSDKRLREKALTESLGSLDAVGRIVRAILDFSGPDEETVAGADLKAVVDNAIRCIGRNLARERITIDLEGIGAGRPAISPLVLQHVILNLVLNAIRALEDGGGTIRVASTKSTDLHIRIIVSDNGPGIPDGMLSTLFDPFTTGWSRTAEHREKRGGSGLGLAISRQIIESAHGTLDCVSKPGAGAEFTIELPLAA